jgi:acyl-CoA synthetase (AMP-forming)/AMP-acid ligase II
MPQEQKVVIVHPELGLPCKPAEAGEIWVSGKSVAHGYWNRIEETRKLRRTNNGS